MATPSVVQALRFCFNSSAIRLSHPERQAHAAIDLLSAQVEANERGVPKFSRFIHITGEWKDGWTAAKR